ncbi:hypothetical protein ACG83_30650 [Frankia sp. R43]|uniref:hypothetical protein n=1 Tax=Frankia sp. R43 TaxID=269536 RepID=UPI0006CA13BB|nr:hypothetical protein [Frankia sp. R43]KPM51944.1 hypothetical protein ACG83_30650 [Frankia sp. R43]
MWQRLLDAVRARPMRPGALTGTSPLIPWSIGRPPPKREKDLSEEQAKKLWEALAVPLEEVIELEKR